MAMPEFKKLMEDVKREVREIPSDTLRQMKSAGEDFSLIDVQLHRHGAAEQVAK